jgi:hypothetical protein
MQHVHQCQLETARSKVCTNRPCLSALKFVEASNTFLYVFKGTDPGMYKNLCVPAYWYICKILVYKIIKFFFETSVESALVPDSLVIKSHFSICT